MMYLWYLWKERGRDRNLSKRSVSVYETLRKSQLGCFEEPWVKDPPFRGILLEEGIAWPMDPHQAHYWLGAAQGNEDLSLNREARTQALCSQTIHHGFLHIGFSWREMCREPPRPPQFSIGGGHRSSTSTHLSYIISMGHFFWWQIFKAEVNRTHYSPCVCGQPLGRRLCPHLPSPPPTLNLFCPWPCSSRWPTWRCGPNSPLAGPEFWAIILLLGGAWCSCSLAVPIGQEVTSGSPVDHPGFTHVLSICHCGKAAPPPIVDQVLLPLPKWQLLQGHHSK